MAARGSSADVPRRSGQCFFSAMTGPYLCAQEWSSTAILSPSKPCQRVYRRCVATSSFRRGGFPSQIGWSPIHRVMRRRTPCALSRGTVPGGPVTSLPAFYLRLWGTNDDHVDPDITWPRAIHRPPHQQHRRDFSFQPSYSGVYEAVPPDSPSSPCTTRTSADRRRYPSLAPVAQHPMPRGFHPRPHDLFSSYKPSHMLPCASRTWLRIRRGQSITNTPCWRGCDQARTASG